ncbi:MAG: hydrogenase, partial [Fibrobacter sp.]|nr:hydrogenase [Fibrobacter sp.]
MTNIINTLLVLILVLNFFSLGSSRIQSIIHTVAIQGVLLGFLPLLVHSHLNIWLLLASLTAIVIKGILIPNMMSRALRNVQIKKEVEPLIGIMPSLILGAIATTFALLFT